MKPAESFDRRVFGRRRTDISAQVRIGYRIVPCIIKDLSDGGALLEFAEHLDLPARLWLSWPDQKTEIVCDVRHTRRNQAGVQFARPQMLALRPAVEPMKSVAVQAAKITERPATARASDIVAQRRRGIRSDDLAFDAQARGEALDVPRDISGLLHSLKTAAAAIVEARARRAVPLPLSALHYAGARIEPGSLAASAHAVRPLRAAVYAGAAVEASAVRAGPRAPLPLAASRLAGAVLCTAEQPAPIVAVFPMAASLFAGHGIDPAASGNVDRVPMPLAASASSHVIAAEDSGRCSQHPCALAVWRKLSIKAASPLPSAAYD